MIANRKGIPLADTQLNVFGGASQGKLDQVAMAPGAFATFQDLKPGAPVAAPREGSTCMAHFMYQKWTGKIEA